METYQAVFKRKEVKYLLTEAQLAALRPALEAHMEPDAFAHSSIYNLYYDTPDDRLIRRSLEKPVYKEKLRLRSYGVPDEETQVFPEIKKKVRGIVYKRRVSMPYGDALRYLSRRQSGGDCFDSNGGLTISGGYVTVWTANAADNEPLDADGAVTVSGGTVLYTGEAAYNASFVFFSSPDLSGGESYTLTSGETQAESAAQTGVVSIGMGVGGPGGQRPDGTPPSGGFADQKPEGESTSNNGSDAKA